jgi:plastocyanin/mono/diheme cytochrome c family protein
MMPTRMTRPPRAFLLLPAVVAIAIGTAACGTQKIHIPSSDPNSKSDYAAAQVFNQRCGGCHTLSYAGTHGSAANPRTAEPINGPNFNVRCERPAIRVLYAISNGGFSGAYMPANVVVGEQARQVALFVSRFAGRDAVTEPGPGNVPCVAQPIGTLPPESGAGGSAGQSTSSSTTPAPGKSVGNTLQLSANATALKFDEASLTAPKAGKVTIVFTNPSPIPHNVTVQEGTNGRVLGHTPTFASGKKSLVLTLPAGKYTYYCSVPGHRQAGMVGTLTVK